MTFTKSLVVAALMSTVGAVSFAQAPAAKPAMPAASAPMAAASAPMHEKKAHKAMKHDKKAKMEAPAAAASATK
ncbi:MAG: hypothetical protein AB9M60_02530 [Leptothrix sp. (in: b-proteobacteria)]